MSAEAAEARTLHRYVAPDGRTIYTNLPSDRLSGAMRAMLEELPAAVARRNGDAD